MHRTLQPELLDSLAPTDPDALHNRRDLRITNRVMGNHRWFEHTLPRLLKPGEQVLELGAGTGELGQRLYRAHIAVDGLDLWPRPDDWPAERGWHRADLLSFTDYARYGVVIGNLIFHQFSDGDLSTFGKKLRTHARVILACEPARRRISQTLFGVFGRALGANHISLHDARVSIAAGFREDELPSLLGLGSSEWDCRTCTTALGAYRMIAVRRSP